MDASPTGAADSGAASPRERLAFAAVLAVALALRLFEAWRTPLWFDEIFTLRAARLPLPAMLGMLGTDIHPPLPTLLLAGWRALGGEAAPWLKLLPIATGVATVAVLYGFAADLFGRRAGLLAAALLAVHRTHVYVSQELRSYALLTLALTLAAWGAWRWAARRPRGAALYVGGAALALHTHYLGGLVLAFLGAWGPWAVRGAPRRWRDWLGLQIAVAVLFAPLVPLFARQLGLSGDHWIPPPTVGNLVSLARQVAFGAIYAVPPFFAAAALPLLRRAQRPGALLLAWLALAPALAAWGLSTRGAHLFTERIMGFALPWWCALLAAAIAGLTPRALAGAAAAVALAFGARAMALKPPMPEAVALRIAAARIAARAEPGDLIVCADTHSLFSFEQHAPGAGRAVLLMQWPRLPYYEGAVFVPESQRVTAAFLEREAAAGRRWWGLRTRHGGLPSDSGAALMTRLARGGRARIEMTTLWAGAPGTDAGP